MKQAPSFTTSRLCIYLLVSILSFASCKKRVVEETTINNSNEATIAKASKPGTYPSLSLRMTVNDGLGNKITSDGQGDYINGFQNMKVEFDIYGNFMFSGASSNPKTSPQRYLNYNFSDPSSLTPNPSVTGTYIGSFISTGQTLTSPDNTPLQNLAINATKCIGFSAGINIDGGVVNFHRNFEDDATSPTAYVYVTRVSSTQWIVTPMPPGAGGCSNISNVAALRVSTVLYGYYNIPFSFTLVAQ
jgi:hypothetical protein